MKRIKRSKFSSRVYTKKEQADHRMKNKDRAKRIRQKRARGLLNVRNPFGGY